MARCRALIDDWFSRYPGESQFELSQRLTCGEDPQFNAAFFELFLHELFLRLGYEVEVHPAAGVPNSPDFLLKRSGVPEVYVEATTTGDKSADQRAANARMNAVYDAINTLECPDFFIGLDPSGSPRTPPPARKFRESVRLAMEALDVAEQASLLASGGIDALPRFTLEHDGWTVSYFFIPKSESARGIANTQPIGMHLGEAGWVDSRGPLLNAVLKKASRYGDLELAYLVAVNTLGFPLQKTDVVEALFGKEQVTVYFNDTEIHSHKVTRRPDGAFTTFGGPRGTRVSGVIHVSTLLPWSVGSAEPVLYHNPFTRYEYAGALSQLPYAKGVNGEMQWFSGVRTRDLFALGVDWPGPHED